MSNSKLVNYIKISPNSSARTAKIDKITIHHMAGNLSVESCGEVFQNTSRQASSNYGVGTDGRIGLYVDESRRAWTSSNRDNDNRAVTIEVANNSGAPNWPVSDKALEATIKLCVDICKRNGIQRLNYTGNKSGNLTMHKWFANTQCPGPYLEGKFQYIADEVNRRLGASAQTTTQSKPVTPQIPSTGPVYRVQVGAYDSRSWANKKRDALIALGFDAIVAAVDDVVFRVQVGAFSTKDEASAMQAKLKSAGYSGFVTILSGKIEGDTSVDRKSDDQIAQEVVWGRWGNGAERISRLTAAGYDYKVIQEKVNKLMNK